MWEEVERAGFGGNTAGGRRGNGPSKGA